MAEHDGKVTFDLEIDTSRVKGDLNKAFAAIKSQANSAKIKVDADTGSALSQLKSVGTAANDIPRNRTVTVTADTSAADSPLEKTKANAEDIPINRTVTVTADTSAADSPLEKTRSNAEDIPENVAVTVTADTSAADSPLETTKALVNDIPREVNISVTANTSGAENALSGLAGAGKEASGGSTGTLGKIAAGAGLAKTLQQIFTSGVAYDSGMAKAQTLFPEGESAAAFGNRLLGLSQETGADIGDLWEGAYNALSASVPYGANGDNLYDFLRTTTYLSKAGFASSEDVSKMVASMGNAYLQAYTPSEIANIAIKAQNKGQLTVGEMVTGAPQFVGGSSVAGVPLEQSLAMYSAMTLGGIPAAQSATAINALFRELTNPKSDTFETMQAAFANNPKGKGKDLAGLMEAGFTMMDVLGAMDSYMKANNIAPGSVLPGEAKTAYDQLSGEKMKGFMDAYDYISSDEDVLSQAYAIMSGTTGTKLSQVKAKLASWGVGISEGVKPMINSALDWIIDPEGSFKRVAETGGWSLDSEYYKRFTDPDAWREDMGIKRIEGPSAALRGAWAAIRSNFQSANNGQPASPYATYTNPYGGATTIPVPTKGKGSAEDLTDSISDTTAAIDSANESASTMAESQAASAEYQAQIAASSEQSAASLETAADSEGQSAKAAQTAATKARQMATRLTSLNSGISGAVSAAINLPGAISSLVAALNRASHASGGHYNDGTYESKNAVGLDRVPFDNYPALLHKGEMVLTAAEASAYRMTGSANNGGGFNAAALAAAMNGVAVEMDGRVVGRLVERSVSAQQAVRLNRTQYGRG